MGSLIYTHTMKHFFLAATFLCLPAAGATAGEWNVAFHFGSTFPTFSQSFTYDPGPIESPVPGVSIEQFGEFRLDASGGAVYAGSVTYYLASFVGVEGRIDAASIDVQVEEPRFTARVDLPRPLSDFTSALDLGAGTVDVEGLRPVSLNLKLRTPGVVRLSASGGLSILPDLRVSATQNVALGVTALDVLAAELEVPPVALRAAARPEDEDEGRFGLNGGVGIEVQVAPHVSLAGEGRYFHFQKRTLRWAPLTEAGSEIEEILLEEINEILEPIEFEPLFFQATLGVVVSF